MKKAKLDCSRSSEMRELSQRPPLLFTHDGLPVFIGDMYQGRSAFLICGGPSFASVDKELLRTPGILTMAVNNAVRSFRPNLWTCVDTPQNFIRSIWADPTIMKFVPVEHAKTPIFDNETWTETEVTTSECPNTFFYMRNLEFDPDLFFEEATVNWGGAAEQGGARSVMLAAIRILYFLGVRDIFLLGVDFDMSPKKRYHFQQARSQASINSNTYTYMQLTDRFVRLQGALEERGIQIYNCNPRSKLEVFPYVSVRSAVKFAVRDMPCKLSSERTEGLYDKAASGEAREETGNSRARVMQFPNLYRGPIPTWEQEGGIIMVVKENNAQSVKDWCKSYYKGEIPLVFADSGASKEMKKWCRRRGRVIQISAVPWRPEPFALSQAGLPKAVVVDPNWKGNASDVLDLVLPTAVALETRIAERRGSVEPVLFSGKIIGSVHNNNFVELMVDYAVNGERELDRMVHRAVYASGIRVVPITLLE